MCTVSMVSDYYQRDPNWTNKWKWVDSLPGQPKTEVIQVVDQETKDMLKEVIVKLDKIDKKLKDVECFDEKKVKFLEALYWPDPVPPDLLPLAKNNLTIIEKSTKY